MQGLRSFALLALLCACGTAHADRLALEHHQPDLVPTAASPYSVELVDGSGATLDTYRHRGRFYVRGDAGSRYSIRIQNPTASRVEAVLSVDGLDVVDGKTASFGKRGYVIPAGGTLKVDGFRVSTSSVAAFRFSSVASSYAGRKGKARNVGVIGVAFFAEREQPVLILPEPRVGALGGSAPPAEESARDSRHRFDADDEARPAPPRKASPGRASRRAPTAMSESVASTDSAGAPATRRRDTVCCGNDEPRHRPGLGTEFGERRHSAVTWTRFERASATTPTAMAELRYNDASGLRALGIRLGPMVSEDEIVTRETASPFPEDRRFALPPR